VKKLTLFLTIFCCMTSFALAQPPDTLWTRSYAIGDFNAVHEVVQTNNDGFVVAGTCCGTIFHSVLASSYLLRTDRIGNEVWTRRYYGGSGMPAPCAELYDVIETHDGDIVAVGNYSISFVLPEPYAYYIVKHQTNGDSLWSRIIAGGGAYSVQETSDGGFIIAGSGVFDLMKVDSNGDSVWTKHYNFSLRAAYPLEDGYIIAGTDEVASNFFLAKTGLTGNILWSYSYGGDGDETLYDMQPTPDGGYILAGSTTSSGAGGLDFYIVKTDAAGNRIWSHNYGGSSNDEAYKVKTTFDGGYVVAGYTQSFGNGMMNSYVIHTDDTGSLNWARVDTLYLSCRAIQQTSDSGYILTELSNRAFTLVKLAVRSLAVDNPVILYPSSFNLSAFPNPFNPSTTLSFTLPQTGSVRLAVYDILGREVKLLQEGIVEAGEYAVTFDGSDLSSGIYFARLESTGMVKTQKLLLLK
jgi:hypothetical protein